MSRIKGSPKTGGRKKGSVNRVTAELKEMILNALDSAGGQDYFVRQAEENPVAFMALLGKILPHTISGDSNQPVVTEIRRVIIEPEAGGSGERERQRIQDTARKNSGPSH